MNCTLQRNAYGPDGIFGILTSDDDQSQIAVTLEHAFVTPDGHLTEYLPKLSAGVYTCVKYNSPRHGIVWMLNNVPGATYIEIHSGNFNKDSDGCILLGRRVISDPDEPDQNMITSSGNSFNKFMDLQRNVESFQLTVKDA